MRRLLHNVPSESTYRTRRTCSATRVPPRIIFFRAHRIDVIEDSKQQLVTRVNGRRGSGNSYLKIEPESASSLRSSPFTVASIILQIIWLFPVHYAAAPFSCRYMRVIYIFLSFSLPAFTVNSKFKRCGGTRGYNTNQYPRLRLMDTRAFKWRWKIKGNFTELSLKILAMVRHLLYCLFSGGRKKGTIGVPGALRRKIEGRRQSTKKNVISIERNEVQFNLWGLGSRHKVNVIACCE